MWCASKSVLCGENFKFACAQSFQQLPHRNCSSSFSTNTTLSSHLKMFPPFLNNANSRSETTESAKSKEHHLIRGSVNTRTGQEHLFCASIHELTSTDFEYMYAHKIHPQMAHPRKNFDQKEKHCGASVRSQLHKK